jgi:hypothetical protein
MWDDCIRTAYEIGAGEFVLTFTYSHYARPFYYSRYHPDTWRERLKSWKDFLSTNEEYLYSTNFNLAEDILFGMAVGNAMPTWFDIPAHHIFYRPSNAPFPANGHEIRGAYESLRHAHSFAEYARMFMNIPTARMYMTTHGVDSSWLQYISEPFETLGLNPELPAHFQYIATAAANGSIQEFHEGSFFSRTFEINDMNNNAAHVETGWQPRIEIDGRNYLRQHNQDGVLIVVYDTALQGVQDIVVFRRWGHAR